VRARLETIPEPHEAVPVEWMGGIR
jgi:hypothetical protein